MEKNKLLTIRITCQENREDLIIIVEDDGIGMEPTKLDEVRTTMEINLSHSEHCGLSNVHERLGLEFGQDYGLQVESDHGKGTRVKMNIALEPGRNLRWS